MDNAPQVFGKYILLERLAAGGMGEVFLAKSGSKGFERLFAIKRLLEVHSGDSEFLSMLKDEAKIAITLVHPNIAQVFEIGEMDGRFFLVMEYIDGISLAKLMEMTAKTNRRMVWSDAIAVARSVCGALAYAHEKVDTLGAPMGIVHRDVSLSNVLVDGHGSVKLIDFGVAKAASSAHRTEAGTIKGKIAYMSPEQARGEPVDARSDLFSVGVVLAECLSYQRYYFATDVMVMMALAQNGYPEPPIEKLLGKNPPAPLVQVLKRSLACDRNQRYASAREMERDLAIALNSCDRAYTTEGLARLVREMDPGYEARKARIASYDNVHVENLAKTVAYAENAPLPAAAVPSLVFGQEMHPVTVNLSDDMVVDKRARWRRLWPVAAVVLAALVLGAMLLLVRGKQPASALPDAAIAAAAALDAASPIAPAVALAPDAAAMRTDRVAPAQSESAPAVTAPPIAATARTRPARPMPAVKAKGCLAVAVEPWAHVILAGKRVGTTPLKCLELEAGDHQITLSNPAIGVTKNVQVKIQAGTTTTVFEKF